MAGYSSHNLEAFVETVDLKSFSAVARKRGLTASTVARQISSLEEELGIALLVRTTRSVVPTAAGRILFERAEHILEELDDAKREARALRSEVSGFLRLSCWPTFAKKCVVPYLPQLMDQHPLLRIDLDLTERLHEPVLDRMDLVIRIGELVDSALLTTKLATQHSVAAASPAYLTKYGSPQTLMDCGSHRLIDKRRPAHYMGWRGLLGDGRTIRQNMVLQTDDLQTQSDAAAAGLGLVYLPLWCIADRLKTGELVALRVEDAKLNRPAGIYLLRNHGVSTAAIDALSAFLREAISKVSEDAMALRQQERCLPQMREG